MVRSESSPAQVWAEVEGVLPFPFEPVSRTLAEPAAWCGFLALHLNTKACAHGAAAQGTPLLVLYSGRKHYEPPDDAYRMDYQFEVREREDGGVRVSLQADEGPLGTEDHRIEVRAAPAPEGTSVHIRSSYVPSFLSRASTGVYLATLGRGKEGFSRTAAPDTGEKRPVEGVRGIIERNAVRYYLALEVFLETRSLPPGERLETRLRTWFERTERYPQLEELSREEYLESKRREQRNQSHLQQTMDASGPGALPGS
ncbi:MAG: hypothetical protein AB1578_18295 [Thermodesulfobacteriota bacterium]|jgi:hypothetical protein